MVDAAKKIRIEFSKMYDEITKKISIDDFVRIMPAGKSQIKEVNTGGVEIQNFIDEELD